MYQEFYNLAKSPFRQPPDLEFYYPARQYERASAYMNYAILNAEGAVMLTGAPGTGKTLLIKRLLSQLDDAFVIAHLFQTQLDDVEILRSILVEFGQKPFSAQKAELLDMLNGFLIETHINSQRPVIIIDDAHNLDVRALEELRMLLGLETDKVKIPQIVLVGSPALKDKLKVPELGSLDAYAHLRKSLEPLDFDETADYIRFRLEVASVPRGELFLEDAIRLIHQASRGVPRKINALCDTALMCGFADEKKQIDANLILSAISELGWAMPGGETASADSLAATIP